MKKTKEKDFEKQLDLEVSLLKLNIFFKDLDTFLRYWMQKNMKPIKKKVEKCPKLVKKARVKKSISKKD